MKLSRPKSASAEQDKPPNFDRIARVYQALEYLALGSLLQQMRTHFLPELADRRQALLLGDGDGRFLARLLASNPLLSADAVDTSAQMLSLLSQRVGPSGAGTVRQLRTHQIDALQFTPQHSPDLVVSHFFFDCLTRNQLERLVRRLVPVMMPGALWLVSDFCIPEGRLRLLGTAYVRSLYLVFRLLTGLRITCLPDHASVLTEAGLKRIHSHSRLSGMLITELWLRPKQCVET